MSDSVFKNLLAVRIVSGLLMIGITVFWDKFFLYIFPWGMGSGQNIFVILLTVSTWILIYKVQHLSEIMTTGLDGGHY